MRKSELRPGWPPSQIKARRPVIYDVFDPPSVRPEEHFIYIKGAAKKPIEASLLRLALDYPCVDLVADFHCVMGWSIEGIVWRGTPLRVLLEEAKPLGRHGLVWA